MATRLFVGNLPDNTEENDLRSVFSNYGNVQNLELKSKSATANESKKFAFVTISGSNYNIESCINHFSREDYNGSRLYVTRARESFLERLQRERLEAQQKLAEKDVPQEAPKKAPVIKLGDKLNPRKRKIDIDAVKSHKPPPIDNSRSFRNENNFQNNDSSTCNQQDNFMGNKKKQDSEIKRIEAMKKRRQEFKEKQMILKSGLTGIDKAPNKKLIFSDNEENGPVEVNGHINNATKANKKNTLFNEDDENENSGDELNFEIKKQYEGKKGQKVLDLQSRYKSDKRFVLDERFIEDDEEEDRKDRESGEEDQIEVKQTDEKAKQLNILQDLLGVEIRKKIPDNERDSKIKKPKIGMLRFDPSQPDHAKFLAPVEDTKKETTKKSKKKKDKQTEETQEKEEISEEPRPEVSKEQFYKVSETLKEAIAQPTSFSLRSLFKSDVVNDENKQEEESANYIPLDTKKKSKIKNPLEPNEKNPFVYDSSDSENEEDAKEPKPEATTETVTESKAVWKESFFFQQSDKRLEDAIAFFTNIEDVQKERRELKSLMKKRIYNKDRKDQMQMFKKKIGGRKKTMKKSFRRKN